MLTAIPPPSGASARPRGSGACARAAEAAQHNATATAPVRRYGFTRLPYRPTGPAVGSAMAAGRLSVVMI